MPRKRYDYIRGGGGLRKDEGETHIPRLVRLYSPWQLAVLTNAHATFGVVKTER